MAGPPAPAPDQTYVSVSPIPAGHITLPERFFVTAADPHAQRTVPSFAFLVTHPTGGALASLNSTAKEFHMLFDLGLRRGLDRYPPPQQAHLASRTPHDFPAGFAAILPQRGLSPADIALALPSHVHYDHHGDPSDLPRATLAVGAGALRVLRDGLPGSASHQHFEPDLFPADRVAELPAPPGASHSPGAAVLDLQGKTWERVGPFAAALDLFADGSVYVVDAPGHLPGHVNLLARLAPKRWAYLAGDACHDRRILTGERGIGTWEGADGAEMCIHVDRAGAERSIGALRRAREEWSAAGEELEVVLGHDEVFERDCVGRLWPSCM